MTWNLFNNLTRKYLQRRYKKLELIRSNPIEFQNQILEDVVQKGSYTQFGVENNLKNVQNYDQFRKIPLHKYEDLYPYIKKMLDGKPDILWPGKILNFSKSSGTTGHASKLIPVSKENLYDCHIAGSWDITSVIYHNDIEASLFKDNSVIMGGSLHTLPDSKIIIGDISALMLKNTPWAGRRFLFPDIDTLLIESWSSKLDKIMKASIQEHDVVMVGGVPTWVVVLLRKIIEHTGINDLYEIWPRAKYYIHGGVSFKPYEQTFKKFFPGEEFQYWEVYNASEGYFAIQDQPKIKELLMLADHGMFFEFLPVHDQNPDNIVPLNDVKTDIKYALVITNNAGLWRYMPGDVISFTSLFPHRIKVVGRISQFINVFGEEVIEDNANQAIAQASKEIGVQVNEYTVAPIHFDDSGKAGHQWIVEFENVPPDIKPFKKALDHSLKMCNTDYAAKRTEDLALQMPDVIPVERGTFLSWMKMRGKYGGQNKVPRLSNEREWVNSLLEYMKIHQYGGSR
jgi:hypothetical protein